MSPDRPTSSSPDRRKRRLPLIAGAAVLTAVAAIAAMWWLTPPPESEFITATVTRGDLEDTVLANGVLQAVRQVDVGAQVNGQLKSLKVRLGDVVKKGDLLAQIDATQPKNTLRQAEAALASQQAQRSAVQARLALARLAWQRQREMRERDATSQQDMDVADADLRAQQAELKALDANIAQQRARVDAARVDLGYTRIVAPIDGEVVALTTLEGQTVVASYQVPTILKLADLGTMTVRAQVSEADVIRIHEQQPVYFTILGAPDKRYPGKLRAIQPSPEKINNAIFFNALFDVPNPERKLRIDMTAQVSILLGEAKGVLMVPLAALGPRAQDGTYPARVLRADHTVETRHVRTGISNRIHTQVLAGLAEGDQVITGDAAGLAATDNKEVLR